MILGIHCSVLGGFDSALRHAEELGCRALQMLPCQRHLSPEAAEMAEFRLERAKGPVRHLLIHSRFVPSLASKTGERRLRSATLLARELSLAAGWNAQYYVLHAGAYSPGSSFKEGAAFLGESLDRAAQAGGRVVPVLLENVPGGGRRMGGTLEELAELLEAVARRLPGAGVCLDTAHAWAAGHEIAGAEGMLGFLSRARGLFGVAAIRAFHLNDTRALLGSHRENHEHWGLGHLGPEGLKALLGSPEHDKALGILETPRDEGWDLKNLDYIRRAVK
ncbi:MAG: deoxyribonuclease IV [Elusimicrobia bacterium]|nr:deoxyribonuclease IV [Elusimicrobiota bacterium]